VAKRIIEGYLSGRTDAPNDKATVTSSATAGLSADLVSRLNFNPISQHATKALQQQQQQQQHQQVVKFNEDSLNKVIVSSTTNDEDSNKKLKLKRKLSRDIDEESYDDDYNQPKDNKPLEYVGFLKNESDNSKKKVDSKKLKPALTASISTSEKNLLNKNVPGTLNLALRSLKSRLSPSTMSETKTSTVPSSGSKIIRLNKANTSIDTKNANEQELINSSMLKAQLESIRIEATQTSQSVFKRIKLNAADSLNASNTQLNNFSIKKTIISQKTTPLSSTNISSSTVSKITPITFDLNKSNSKSTISNSIKTSANELDTSRAKIKPIVFDSSSKTTQSKIIKLKKTAQQQASLKSDPVNKISSDLRQRLKVQSRLSF
jgi:hypothetical protein